jgi:hypothetical protein
VVDSKEAFKELYRLAMTTLRPEPVVIYKPKKGNGLAAKFNLRLLPKYESSEADGPEYLKDVDGGLFVDLVAEGPEKNGFPTFKWDDRASLVTAKLGLPDVSNLLVAIRDFRGRGLEVPTYLRGQAASAKPNQVSLFHKHDVAGTTGISYTFQEESSILRVSKSKDKFASIALTLSEEVILEQYLRHALDAFIRVGMR